MEEKGSAIRKRKISAPSEQTAGGVSGRLTAAAYRDQEKRGKETTRQERGRHNDEVRKEQRGTEIIPT